MDIDQFQSRSVKNGLQIIIKQKMKVRMRIAVLVAKKSYKKKRFRLKKTKEGFLTIKAN